MSTLAVHAGTERGPGVQPVVPPIHPSVSYLADEPDDLRAVLAGEKDGYVYSRNGNPTVAALRRAVAALEGAEDAAVFASGMAAIHAALLAAGASPGATFIVSRDLYGVSAALLNNVLVQLGVRVVYADLVDAEAAREEVQRERPLVMYCETLSNPLLRVADIAGLAEIAHESGALLVVDNTFAGPTMVRPLALGADISVTSTTKYLSGHGDVLGGAAAGAWDVCGRMMAVGTWAGGVAGPFESWLTLRGIRTLGVRLPRQYSNAAAIARLLKSHPAVSTVHYPGLQTHPQHELATRQFGGQHGGMVSFELVDDTSEAAHRFMRALRVAIPATTLGDVFTLVLHPETTSHIAVSEATRRAAGIRPGLLRLSAGIEDQEDVLADVAQALAAVQATHANAYAPGRSSSP